MSAYRGTPEMDDPLPNRHELTKVDMHTAMAILLNSPNVKISSYWAGGLVASFENCSGPFCSAELAGYSLIKSDKPTGLEARALS